MRSEPPLFWLHKLLNLLEEAKLFDNSNQSPLLDSPDNSLGASTKASQEALTRLSHVHKLNFICGFFTGWKLRKKRVELSRQMGLHFPNALGDEQQLDMLMRVLALAIGDPALYQDQVTFWDGKHPSVDRVFPSPTPGNNNIPSNPTTRITGKILSRQSTTSP